MAAELRPYQQRAIDELYAWLRAHRGNPCLVLPTGSGKSHIVAAICRDAVTRWPATRILMLTHVRELIAQNAEKMRAHWPNAPLGIYSAGLASREVERITFAGIQSVRDKAALLGHRDVVIIDEAHLVSHKDQGGYRALISDLQQINPKLRVVGLTATPWRLGHGRIDEGDALFDALLEPVSIEELVHGGYLAPLRSRVTHTQVTAAGVHRRGGEYVEAELQKAVNTGPLVQGAVTDILQYAGDRRHWLVFCTGVAHAEAVAEELRARGIAAATVTGAMRPMERDDILRRYKAGRITAITNANVLTTGFDFPDIDLIAMLRPTLSPTLYVQMAGRGMRLKSHTDHCLVLDFAGVVRQHGPITAVEPPTAAGEGSGEAPVKVCPECFEIVHAAVRVCPGCGLEFPPPEPKRPELHDDDIMGETVTEILPIRSWYWGEQTSRKTGIPMAVVEFDPPTLSGRKAVTHYACVAHPDPVGRRALEQIARWADAAGVGAERVNELARTGTIADLCREMEDAPPPRAITVRREGRWWRVVEAAWEGEVSA